MDKKTCCGITIQLGDRDPENAELGYVKSTCKIWESTLERDTCSHCGKPDCCYTCEDSAALRLTEGDPEDEVAARLQFNGALDGIEALVLAAAVANIDIESLSFEESVETAVASFLLDK